MEIKDKEFTLKYDATTGRLVFTGILRRMSKDYKEIQDLLDHITRNPPTKLDIDIFALQMMNSSGLNTLSRFILGLRVKTGLQVSFHGAKDIVWHAKTLQNMKHFLPSASLLFR